MGRKAKPKIGSREHKPIECEIPDDAKGLEDGDEFTIEGYKLMPDGTIITNCKPGEETLFVARKGR